ncbi:pilus assembly protein TadG-related protein [Porphyrobacter sp. AAP60]|uniref:pilus assembly protein TadG-related protein n=1 Tax=Porphyrobacter sp. AAP60 TaxID=1523423 RepID=UPI000A4B4E5F|nr:pilus assembly protein TadG-related protein [Porphyrobacter sp. AAP60]
MERKTPARRPFLRSLLCDTAANTIAISAAAMFPLLAMVGGGVDASRYYMTAARMQAACDAGALAARRAMVDDNFTSEHRTIGLNFFDQNFDDGIFGSEERVRDYTSDGEGVVTGTASATLPTTIMGAFGFGDFDLSVTCSAEINISNTDIVFVLDVTGSMNCPDNNIAGCTNGNNNNVEASNSLIVGLRDAVMSFYDTVESATSAAAQVRYGLVPYAHTINVGFDLPRQYLADTHSYQSRVPRFQNVQQWQTRSNQVEWVPRFTSNFGSGNTDHYRFNNSSWSVFTADSTDRSRCLNMNGVTYSVGAERWRVSNPEYRLNVWSGGSSSARAGCRATVRKQEQVTVNQFQDYVYCSVTPGATGNCGVNNPAGSPVGWETVNLSSLYNTRTIQMPTGTNGAMQTLTWDGCIEEANTVNTGNFSPVPANAFDLNINLVPTNEAQKWKPQLNNAIWRRFNGSGQATTANIASGDNNNWRPFTHCVREARKLDEWTRVDLRAYVDSLVAFGGTYHDLGMIWGARYISPRGIFRSENEAAPNGDAIARHIVFMTDGALAPNASVYSSYGVEPWDRRITTDGSTGLNDRHEARFQVACRAARQENITVWVVAFGTELTPELTSCASPGRAYQASNNAALTSAFQEIAQKIAALRLTQ